MRSAELAPLGFLFFGLVACGSDVATVELALASDPPEEIETMTVFVTDLDLGFIVASATVTRERTRFPLGVPAERPLEFTLIARRAEPPPSLLGPMPSYVGRTRRRISLGSERELVSLVGRPGGTVTVIVPEPEDGDIESRPRFEVEGEGERPTRVYDLARRSGGWTRSIALESGAARVRLLADRGGRRWTTSGIAQFRRDEDTLVSLDMPKETSALAVVPSKVTLSLSDPQSAEAVEDDVLLGAPLPALLLSAQDDNGEPFESLPRVRLRLRRYPIDSEPEDVELGAIVVGEPMLLDELSAPEQPERWWIRGDFDTDVPLRVELFINFKNLGEDVGSASTLLVDLDEAHRLGRGTGMIVSALDERGLWVRSWTADFDLSASDLDIVLGESAGRLRAAERGVKWIPIQRSSASITGEAALRGTVTSTTQSWELEQPLPLVELLP